MAQVYVNKVRELTSEGVVFDDSLPLAWAEGMKLWRVGSVVTYTHPGWTSLDEIEEGADAITGRFREDQATGYVFFDCSLNGRTYAIPKDSLMPTNKDLSACQFLARKNRVLCALPTLELPEVVSRVPTDSCNICCLSFSQSEPISTPCKHYFHLDCLKTYIQAQKLLRCPVFTCKKALPDTFIP
jgi:hypothetical protein